MNEIWATLVAWRDVAHGLGLGATGLDVLEDAKTQGTRFAGARLHECAILHEHAEMP
jgi:hypothetical protein